MTERSAKRYGVGMSLGRTSSGRTSNCRTIARKDPRRRFVVTSTPVEIVRGKVRVDYTASWIVRGHDRKGTSTIFVYRGPYVGRFRCWPVRVARVWVPTPTLASGLRSAGPYNRRRRYVQGPWWQQVACGNAARNSVKVTPELATVAVVIGESTRVKRRVDGDCGDARHGVILFHVFSYFFVSFIARTLCDAKSCGATAARVSTLRRLTTRGVDCDERCLSTIYHRSVRMFECQQLCLEYR